MISTYTPLSVSGVTYDLLAQIPGGYVFQTSYSRLVVVKAFDG